MRCSLKRIDAFNNSIKQLFEKYEIPARRVNPRGQTLLNFAQEKSHHNGPAEAPFALNRPSGSDRPWSTKQHASFADARTLA